MYNQKSVKNQEGRTSQKNGVIWYPSHDSVRILSSTLYSECAIGTYTDTLTNVWTVTNFSIHINSSSPLPTFWIFSSNFTCNKYKRVAGYYIAFLSFIYFPISYMYIKYDWKNIRTWWKSHDNHFLYIIIVYAHALQNMGW